MKPVSNVIAAICTASIAANVYVISKWLGRDDPVHVTYREDIPVVVRHKGGLMEVSTIWSNEVFQANQNHSILGIPMGQTVTQIRVPAVFHYQVDLAPEWKVLLRDKSFIVIAPSVTPSLPVAVNLAMLQQQASGTWSLFTGAAQLSQLQASITQELAKKALLPGYVELQRETARKTVKEFVAKWLITQEQWKGASKYPIHVFFADEPIRALGSAPLPPIDVR